MRWSVVGLVEWVSGHPNLGGAAMGKSACHYEAFRFSDPFVFRSKIGGTKSQNPIAIRATPRFFVPYIREGFAHTKGGFTRLRNPRAYACFARSKTRKGFARATRKGASRNPRRPEQHERVLRATRKGFARVTREYACLARATRKGFEHVARSKTA